MNVEQFQLHQSERSMAHQLVGSASEKISQSHSEYHVESFVDDTVVVSSAVNDTMLLQRKDGNITAGTKSVKGSTPTISSDKLGKSVETHTRLSNQPRGLILQILCTHFPLVSLLSFFLPNPNPRFSIQFPI